MQSLSRGIIKNENVDLNGDALIETDYFIQVEEEKKVETEPNVRENFEKLGINILNNAQKKAQEKAREIIENAISDAESLKKDAYDSAYEKGYNNGYKEGYEKSIEEAKAEKESLIRQGEDILYCAKDEYARYFKEKEKEIIDIILNIAYKFLRREVEEKDAIVHMIEDEFEKINKAESILLKFNPTYYEEISKKLKIWKMSYAIGEVFLLTNEKLELGTVIMERENGKCKLSLPYALDKIKEELLK